MKKFYLWDRKPNKFRKIRRLVSNNKTGDVYGITIPQEVAQKFNNVHFKILCGETNIILLSGCKI